MHRALGPAHGILCDPKRPRAGGDPWVVWLQRRVVAEGPRPLLPDGAGEAPAERRGHPRTGLPIGGGHPPAVPHPDRAHALGSEAPLAPRANVPWPRNTVSVPKAEEA